MHTFECISHTSARLVRRAVMQKGIYLHFKAGETLECSAIKLANSQSNAITSQWVCTARWIKSRCQTQKSSHCSRAGARKDGAARRNKRCLQRPKCDSLCNARKILAVLCYDVCGVRPTVRTKSIVRSRCQTLPIFKYNFDGERSSCVFDRLRNFPYIKKLIVLLRWSQTSTNADLENAETLGRNCKVFN